MTTAYDPLEGRLTDAPWDAFERLLAALAGTKTRAEVAGAVTEQAAFALAASSCLVAVLDEEGGALEVLAVAGYPPGSLAAGQRLALSSDLLLTEAARTGAAVVRATTQAVAATDVTAGHRAFLALPLLAADRPVGAIAFGFAAPLADAGAVARVGAAVAAQCALALDRLRSGEAERAALAAERTARERVAFLADASALLAGSLEVQATLESLTRLVVPRLADWCAVHVPNPAGEAQLAAVHHRHPEGLAAVTAALEGWHVAADFPHGAPAVLATGATQLYPTIPEAVRDGLVAAAPDRVVALRALPMTSGIAVPLIARGRAVGALTLIREQGDPYAAAELELAEDLGRRAGLAMDNALSYSLASEALAERDDAAAAARQESERLASVLEQVPVGVIVAEAPDGRVVLRNAALEEIWGDPCGAFDGATVSGRLRATGGDGQPMAPAAWPLARALADGEVVRAEQAELTWPDGTRTSIEVNAGPVRDREGRVVAAVATFTDVTRRVADDRMLARSMARAAELAYSLQASLLPPDLPAIPGAQLAATYQAVGEGLEVGGDFYDVSPSGRDDEWAIAMGDVCGKGVEAAAVTSLARYTLRAAGLRARRPSVILSRLNEVMLRHETERPFVTAVYAVLHAGGGGRGLTVNLAVGGHPLPLVLRADGRVETAGEPGTLVGILEEAEFTDATVALAPGDALLLYTDGITESRRGAELFGDVRLAEALAGCAGRDATGIVQGLEETVAGFRAGRARDDLALLVIRAEPGRAPGRGADRVPRALSPP